MVKWLVDHPVDCIMLFSEDRSAPHPEGRAPGRTKLEICAVITEVVFKDDKDYAQLFALHAAKFTKAVQDHLGILKKAYHEQAVKFTQTGNGIVPDSEGHSNSMCGRKGISMALVNSAPGASQGTQLLSLVQNKSLPNATASSSPFAVGNSTAATPDPPIRHQDKGKERAAGTLLEGEMLEFSQDYDIDGGNFGGSDCPINNDTDMYSGFAQGYKSQSPSPPSLTAFIHQKKSPTPDMDNCSAFRSGSPASQTSLASHGCQAHHAPSSYRSSSVMSSGSSHAGLSSVSDSSGISQNASLKRSKTLALPSRDSIPNLLNKGMAAINNNKM
ncbi:hypothetical protein BS17DRAFT_820630 [Gyrodon lividus]|nr:hypothetical protein BS17DRAFT_820630 [Gyrodon lividus]